MADDDKPWVAGIKSKGKLSVYSVPSLKSSLWGRVLPEAIKEFNALSKHYHLGVTLIHSATAPSAGGGADIQVEDADGKISATWNRKTVGEFFRGDRAHGRTFSFGNDDETDRAFVFLPRQPKTLPPTVGWRAVGANGDKVIAGHELIHACGLVKHSTDDLCYDYPAGDHGSSAAGDKIAVDNG